MAEQVQLQIEELNQKMDTLLEYVNEQRLKSRAIDDLVEDVSLIGKDVYRATVKSLDDHEVVLDPDELRELGIRFAQNIGNFNRILDSMGSLMDLMKDVGPIANEVIIDLTKRLHEFEQKGYFEFLREAGQILDNIITHYSADDVRMLANNVVAILDTVKNLTQPEMLNSVDNAVKVFSNLEMDEIPSYSMFGLLREMNKPEMKKAMGFFLTFMKNIGTENTKENQLTEH